MAGLASSTLTDLLIDQRLYNIFTLQSSTYAEFMQSALQAVNTPCRITSQISYTHVKHHPLFNGIDPFSKEGRALNWHDKRFSPLFKGVQDHLSALNLSLYICFNSTVDLQSRLIKTTLAPLAFKNQVILKIRKGVTETHIVSLFENLDKANLHELSDISPLFDTVLRLP
jgi:hypothetical protein